jgi:hypothetical protein
MPGGAGGFPMFPGAAGAYPGGFPEGYAEEGEEDEGDGEVEEGEEGDEPALHAAASSGNHEVSHMGIKRFNSFAAQHLLFAA